MGIVMLASDPLLGRNVALKVLRSSASGDPEERRERFLREARAMAKLSHENVIVVHEVGTHDGQVYVAMEHVAGTTLARWQRGRGWKDVVSVYVRAGRGLAAAHEVGLVHRDFKPDNVLIGNDGRVRVTDFGLVAATDAMHAEGRSIPPDAGASSLTQTGALLGTPRYMAPEQHEGTTVDARADQFGFCVALFEALYHCPPFGGTTYAELASSVISGQLVPLPASDVPVAVRDAVVRGLRRDRDERFPSLRDLLAVLEASIATPAPAQARGRRKLVLALALLGVVVAVFAFKLRSDASHAHDRADELESTVAELKLKLDAKSSGDPRSPTMSADEANFVGVVFDAAQADYQAGRYVEAAARFLSAYDLKKFPQFLFNAGAAHDMRSRRDHDPAAARAAIALYRRYLDASPGAVDHDTVRKQIELLEDQLPSSSAPR